MKDYLSRQKNQTPMAAHPLQWLAQPSSRHQLLEHAQRLIEIEHVVHRCLPPALRAGCRALRFEQGVLYLGVPSGQFASRIKQLSERMVTHLQEARWPAQRIHIRVLPQSSHLPPNPYQPRPQPKKLSPAAAQAFAELKKELPDGPLAQAVEQLLTRHS